MKIALTGSTGLVGSRVVELLNQDFEFIPLLSKNLDLTNQTVVDNYLDNLDYDLLLHLAAYTNVDQAEVEKELAWKLNVLATKYLFKTVARQQKKFIFISTEFVFDGQTAPFTEKSLPKPLGYYGLTKYEGEKIVQNQAMIVRISSPYKKETVGKKDFANRIRELLINGQTLQMVINSLFTPTFIDDIAFGLKYLINNYTPEIYHLVGADSFSPYEAGKLIAKTFGLNSDLIQPISYAKYFAGKAPRPKNGTVISLKNTFWPMSTFAEGLTKIRGVAS
jgi:dTDP-4-dehydrorhamnose reductase